MRGNHLLNRIHRIIKIRYSSLDMWSSKLCWNHAFWLHAAPQIQLQIKKSRQARNKTVCSRISFRIDIRLINILCINTHNLNESRMDCILDLHFHPMHHLLNHVYLSIQQKQNDHLISPQHACLIQRNYRPITGEPRTD